MFSPNCFTVDTDVTYRDRTDFMVILPPCIRMRRLVIIRLAVALLICIGVYLCIFIVTRSPSPVIFGERRLFPSIKYGHQYCVVLNATRNSKSFRDDGLHPISLASHTTPNYITEVINAVDSWDGPVSLSIFVDRSSARAVDLLLNMHRCDRRFTQKLSLHVVFRLSAFHTVCPSVAVQLVPCANFTAKYKNRLASQLASPFGIYPINVMRNIARLGTASPILIVSDIEMIFSKGFAVQMKRLANKHITEESRNLIVIRRFELNNTARAIPKNSTELRRLVDAKMAFEFHQKMFALGHTIPGLWHWFRKSKIDKEPTMWDIPYKSSSWEPQVIMHSSAPLSEESMPTRIRDHQALIYELCRANYSFHLASKVFNVHRGIKTAATNMDVAVRAHQGRLRARSFRSFMDRIDEQYPKTTNTCKQFIM